MSSQICLKWNSFLNNIATSFESLWEEEGLVDVTLASDGRCLTAHKVILSASSPFFKKVFQTNPCQHPVIVLQDVRFSELEALLIFIYKGEVNIEQRNLPALLKAAETLQIRGLSGGDIFSKESYERLVELEQEAAEDARSVKEDAPRKKQRISKRRNDSGAEKVLNSRLSRTESTSESTTSEQSGKDADYASSDNLPNPAYHRLEMKIEPLEVTMEDLQKDSPLDKDDTSERLETKPIDEMQGSSKSIVNTILDRKRASSVSPEPTLDGDGSLKRSNTLERDARYSSFVPNRIPNETVCDRMEFARRNEPQVSDECGVLALSQEPLFSRLGSTDGSELSEETFKGGPAYPPFPCPFCDRAYTSWGFRRRHIKAVHTISPSLNCKWCLQVLPTHAAWRRHVMSAHNLSANDAHNGLLILEEAHMVLQIARPTRLDTMVNIIKQNSRQNCNQDDSQPDKG